MNPAELEEAKVYAIQMWDLEKQMMKVVPSSRNRDLLMDLVRLEDKPVDIRTGGEQWEIDNILEKLADKPPYRKQTRPPLTNAIQPVRSPLTEIERMVQMEPQVKSALEALEGHVAAMGPFPPGVQFEVVEGYGPMMARIAERERAAKAIAEAQAAVLAKLNRPNMFVRFGRWVRGLYKGRRLVTERDLLDKE